MESAGPALIGQPGCGTWRPLAVRQWAFFRRSFHIADGGALHTFCMTLDSLAGEALIIARSVVTTHATPSSVRHDKVSVALCAGLAGLRPCAGVET